MEKPRAIEMMNEILSYANLDRKEFSEKIGEESAQWIADILNPNKKVGISKQKAEKIHDAFPQIRMEWLTTGKGEMLEADTRDDYSRFHTSEIYREDEIPDRFVTYLVPMAAMAGGLIGMDGEEGVSQEDCEKVISPIADSDWAVPVCGDSMEPEYPNGSRVFVKRIDPDDFIAWGNVFVIDTTNGLLIKVVQQSEREDCIRCVSLNPSGRYAPFDVPKRTIRAMYRVLMCVSVK